tara:strand:+ start:3687 stop:4439 length:753 start_codon:yes stop_codon:yes gene_type:complete
MEKDCFEIAFENWLSQNTSLSEKSQRNYLSAIKGSLSQRCIDYGLTKKSLLQIRDPILFKDLRNVLEGDERYITLNSTGNDMYKRAMDYFSSHLDDDLPAIEVESSVSEPIHHPIITTETISIVKARKGQGPYRENLDNYWNRSCSVTGAPDSDEGTLLIASHIKPWASSNNLERLDVFNGLLLAPNLDKAFDKGYISFDEDGLILISGKFNSASSFGVTPSLCISKEKISPNHGKYLRYHRENIYKSAA